MDNFLTKEKKNKTRFFSYNAPILLIFSYRASILLIFFSIRYSNKVKFLTKEDMPEPSPPPAKNIS